MQASQHCTALAVDSLIVFPRLIQVLLGAEQSFWQTVRKPDIGAFMALGTAFEPGGKKHSYPARQGDSMSATLHVL
jgi:hypothetical protein